MSWLSELFGKSRAEKKQDQRLDAIEQKLKNMATKLTDLEAELKAVRDTNTKALGEIRARLDALTGRITILEEQLAAGELTEGQQTALNELKASAQALDDVVPDAPPA